MPTNEILAIGRVAERLVICVLAGASLTYGWNLFRIGVLSDQSAEFTALGWRASLKRVGPGVFFALFGAAILSISLRSPLTLEPAGADHSNNLTNTLSNNSGPQSASEGAPKSTPVQSAGDSQMAVSYFGSDNTGQKQLVASINTLQQLVTPVKFSLSAEQNAVAKSLEDIESARDTLLVHRFGAEMFRDYKQYRKRVAADVDVGEKDKSRFAEIDSWSRANRIMN
jgi:hypothetical protein